MLYLKPPFHIIEGTAVFPDHASETQFYFLPAMPRLTTLRDPATGLEIPQLQLIKFRGDAGTGGFLTFEVNLGLEQERLDAIAAQLRRIHQLREDPVLAPAILESGTVRLIILGRASDENGQPILDDQAQQRFVLKIAHARSPALYGDNQAIFSVELDQDGVQLIESSIVHSELMPIGVIYSLDFLALRPAFSVKITADWNRVQTHFEESFTADVLFASVEIDKVVDKLIEDQVVLIEVDSFLPEDEDAGSWVGRRDQAIDQFKDMVLENFFQPSIEPMKEETDGWDRFADTAERLALVGATGGWGVAKFSYVKKDLTRIDQKRANLQMNERVTVRRSIYPQATLKGLGRFLRDAEGQIDVGRFVQSVTLDDPWFDKREVQAHSLVDFDHDRVDSVNVTLTYDHQPRTIRLTKEASSGAASWNSRVVNGLMVYDVDYEYRVNFRGVDTAERPGLVVVQPEDGVRGEEFEISPRGEGRYFTDDVQIGTGQIPWARYPQVFVEVRYADPANGIRLAESFLLTENAHEATWTRFRLDPALSAYDVRVTYLALDQHDVEVDWTTTDQERLLIKDPHPLRRAVQVVPAVDWNLVSVILVELRYVDEANGVDEGQSLTFFNTPADKAPKSFSINLVDANHRLVNYTATIVLADNRTLVVPPSMTASTSIVLRTDMAGHRIVTVQPPDADFAQRGLVRVEARLSFHDPSAGLDYEDSFSFTERGGREFFEFDYTAVERSQYRASVTLVLTNGLVVERDLGQLDTDRLVLPSA